jgi:hypothetical protein
MGREVLTKIVAFDDASKRVRVEQCGAPSEGSAFMSEAYRRHSLPPSEAAVAIVPSVVPLTRDPTSGEGAIQCLLAGDSHQGINTRRHPCSA